MDLGETIKASNINGDDLMLITRNIATTSDSECRRIAVALAILAHLRGGERPHEETPGLEGRL